MRANEHNLQLGWDSIRPSLWRGAWSAFVENPLFGDSYGPAHSYILKGSRMMGLVFLVPFLAGLWLVWRRASWLKRQTTSQFGLAVAIGLQGVVIVAIALNTTGNMLGTFVVYYFFILVGLLEAIYQDVRHGRDSFAGQQGSMAVKQQERAE